MNHFCHYRAGLNLLSLASCLAAGCVGLPQAEPAAPPPARTIKLSYRTAADRLNVAAGGTQLVSYQQPLVSPLPSCCVTTLNITSPHPRGIPGLAQATVIMKADAQPAVAPSVWQWVSGSAADPAATPGPTEVWVMDIPQWQVDAILAKIEASSFFQRSKVWSADVFLAAEVGPKKNGKDVKALPELDALILRSRTDGRLVAGGGLTQFAAPTFAMQPSHAPQPQFAPPQFAQQQFFPAGFSQPQFVPPQFPQPPAGQAPFGPPQFPAPPFAPPGPPPPAFWPPPAS